MPVSDTPETEGLSQRALLLELREDMKKVLEKMPTFVTWRQLAGVMAATATIVIGVLSI